MSCRLKDGSSSWYSIDEATTFAPYPSGLRDMVANQAPPKITGQEFAYEKANMQIEDIRELM
eukprot:1155662-Pelagomonas_calceolata.AAC.3